MRVQRSDCSRSLVKNTARNAIVSTFPLFSFSSVFSFQFSSLFRLLICSAESYKKLQKVDIVSPFTPVLTPLPAAAPFNVDTGRFKHNPENLYTLIVGRGCK